MTGIPLRKVSHEDLVDRLRSLEAVGFAVPDLRKISMFKVEYMGTTTSGTEIYRHGRELVEVKAGQNIDDEGNVVDFNAIRSGVYGTLALIKNPRKDEFVLPLPSKPLLGIDPNGDKNDSGALMEKYSKPNRSNLSPTPRGFDEFPSAEQARARRVLECGASIKTTGLEIKPNLNYFIGKIHSVDPKKTKNP